MTIVVRGSLLPVMAQASESTADPRSVRFGQLARIQETSAIARFAMRLAFGADRRPPFNPDLEQRRNARRTGRCDGWAGRAAVSSIECVRR